MNSMEIVNAATERYNAKFQELKAKEQELNNQVSDFEKFWRKTLKKNILRYCDYVEDIGLIAKEREYKFEGGEYTSNIEVEQFIDQRRDLSEDFKRNITQSFEDFSANLVSGLSSGGPKGEAVAGAAVGLAVNIVASVAAAKLGQWVDELQQKPRAMEFEAKIDIAIEEMNKTFTLFETYNKHVLEVWDNIKKIVTHTESSLNALEPLVPDFRKEEEDYVNILKQSRILIEALGELMQINLIDKTGNIAPECYRVFKKVSTITNRR